MRKDIRHHEDAVSAAVATVLGDLDTGVSELRRKKRAK